MIVMMRTLYAGPAGVFEPDRPVDLPDAEARDLIESGFAVDPAQPRTATDPARSAETATIHARHAKPVK